MCSENLYNANVRSDDSEPFRVNKLNERNMKITKGFYRKYFYIARNLGFCFENGPTNKTSK